MCHTQIQVETQIQIQVAGILNSEIGVLSFSSLATSNTHNYDKEIIKKQNYVISGD